MVERIRFRVFTISYNCPFALLRLHPTWGVTTLDLCVGKKSCMILQNCKSHSNINCGVFDTVTLCICPASSCPPKPSDGMIEPFKPVLSGHRRPEGGRHGRIRGCPKATPKCSCRKLLATLLFSSRCEVYRPTLDLHHRSCSLGLPKP